MPVLAIDRQTGILIGLASLAVSAALVSWGAWLLLRRERRAQRDAGELPPEEPKRRWGRKDRATPPADATAPLVDLRSTAAGAAPGQPPEGKASGEAPEPARTGTPARSWRGARARRR